MITHFCTFLMTWSNKGVVQSGGSGNDRPVITLVSTLRVSKSAAEGTPPFICYCRISPFLFKVTVYSYSQLGSSLLGFQKSGERIPGVFVDNSMSLHNGLLLPKAIYRQQKTLAIMFQIFLRADPCVFGLWDKSTELS